MSITRRLASLALRVRMKQVNWNSTWIYFENSTKYDELGVRADGSFRIQEGESIQVFISSMVPKEQAAPTEEATDAPAGGEDVVMSE